MHINPEKSSPSQIKDLVKTKELQRKTVLKQAKSSFTERNLCLQLYFALTQNTARNWIVCEAAFFVF